jgi:hypothetical protein
MESFHAKLVSSPLQDKEVEISENSDYIDYGTTTQIRREVADQEFMSFSEIFWNCLDKNYPSL